MATMAAVKSWFHSVLSRQVNNCGKLWDGSQQTSPQNRPWLSKPFKQLELPTKKLCLAGPEYLHHWKAKTVKYRTAPCSLIWQLQHWSLLRSDARNDLLHPTNIHIINPKTLFYYTGTIKMSTLSLLLLSLLLHPAKTQTCSQKNIRSECLKLPMIHQQSVSHTKARMTMETESRWKWITTQFPGFAWACLFKSDMREEITKPVSELTCWVLAPCRALPPKRTSVRN